MVHSPSNDGEQVHQEEACDQGGAQDVHAIEEEAQPAPPTQVRATIQRFKNSPFFPYLSLLPTRDQLLTIRGKQEYFDKQKL
jgi:hypothetical protein